MGYNSTIDFGRWQVMKKSYNKILSSALLTVLVVFSAVTTSATASSGLLIPDRAGENSEYVSVEGIVGGMVLFDYDAGAIIDAERTVTVANIPSQINGVPVIEIGLNAFVSTDTLTKIVIPEGVTTIADYAIVDNDNLTEVIIPNTVTEIGEGAFNGNPSLTQIAIPESVTRIGDDAFSSNYSLTEITIPEGVVFLGDSVFRQCTSLESVHILAELTNIPDGTFSGCSSIKEITLPNTIVSIGNSAFNGCTSLESISIPEGVTSIESGAFMYCTSLSSVVLPSTLTGRLESTFWYCSSLTNVNIPEGVTELYYTFADCVSLTEITLPMSLKSLETDAFANSGIVEIEIPPNVSEVLQSSLKDCMNLTKVTMNEGIESISLVAFGGSTNLKEIVIPKSVEEIRSADWLEFPNLTDVYYGGSEQDWQNFIDENFYSGGEIETESFLSATFHYDHPMKVFGTETDTADVSTDENESETEVVQNEQSEENNNSELQNDESEKANEETENNVENSASIILIGGIVISLLCVGIGFNFVARKKNTVVALGFVIVGIAVLVVAYIIKPTADVVDHDASNENGEDLEEVDVSNVDTNNLSVFGMDKDNLSAEQLETYNVLINTLWVSTFKYEEGMEDTVAHFGTNLDFHEDGTVIMFEDGVPKNGTWTAEWGSIFVDDVESERLKIDMFFDDNVYRMNLKPNDYENVHVYSNETHSEVWFDKSEDVIRYYCVLSETVWHISAIEDKDGNRTDPHAPLTFEFTSTTDGKFTQPDKIDDVTLDREIVEVDFDADNLTDLTENFVLTGGFFERYNHDGRDQAEVNITDNEMIISTDAQNFVFQYAGVRATNVSQDMSLVLVEFYDESITDSSDGEGYLEPYDVFVNRFKLFLGTDGTAELSNGTETLTGTWDYDDVLIGPNGGHINISSDLFDLESNPEFFAALLTELKNQDERIEWSLDSSLDVYPGNITSEEMWFDLGKTRFSFVQDPLFSSDIAINKTFY